MPIKRRSNWYIYLITFVVTFVVLSLIIASLWTTIFPSQQVSSTKNNVLNSNSDGVPELNIVFMLSDTIAGAPNSYMIINYLPEYGSVTCIPLRPQTEITTGNRSKNLTEVFEDGNCKGVTEAVAKYFNIECTKYVKFDRMSFVQFVDFIDGVKVNVPYEINTEKAVIPAGTIILKGSELYEYLNYSDFKEGEEYKYSAQGSAVSAIINSNMKQLETPIMQSYFNNILDSAGTNFNFDDYTKYQKSFLHTSNNITNPAKYYIPYGEEKDGNFIIDGLSKTEISEQFNIYNNSEE